MAWCKAELATQRSFVALLLCVAHHCHEGEGRFDRKSSSPLVVPDDVAQLATLRGGRMVEARMRIGSSMGLRVGVELRGVRRLAEAISRLEFGGQF